ncbi:MAG: tRNA dihydrouridine synthase DusB [Desulfuromonadaceae bacterium]|nr:tRNA dihydrouridine synthase DusB [Desulfuromonadaceae bacterium]
MTVPTLQIGQLHLKNNVILAPMAGITNLAYRAIHKKAGAGLVYSEMISANGLIRDGRKTLELLASEPSEAPLAAQLFGDDPDVLSQAARIATPMAHLLDINMGCPVKKVVRSGAGSALLHHPQKVAEIVRAVRHVTQLPLTIKIRSGWSQQEINYLEIGHIAQEEGADAVTLHPRTRCQGFSGHADWDQIAQLKNALTIPVIGSGDIFTPQEALDKLSHSGCDGIMIGRGGYGNPWLIENILRLMRGDTPVMPSRMQRGETALEHLQRHIAQIGAQAALPDMRKHLCWYARGLSGATEFRARVNQTTQREVMEELIRGFFFEDNA